MEHHEAEIGFVLALGHALHRYGTPAHRLEDKLRKVCTRLGLETTVFVSPTAIIMSFGRPTDLKSRLIRIDDTDLDMCKLARIDALADEVAGHALSPEEGLRRLEAIQASARQFGSVPSTLVHALVSGAVAVFFGGSSRDVALAAAIGLALGLLAQLLARSTERARVFVLVGAALASCAAGVVASWSTQITPSIVTISALIVLLPGLTLTIAMIEIATKNIMAGTARLVMAIVVLLELVIGVAVGERLAAAIVTVHHATPNPMPEWTKWLALVAASLGLAVFVQAQLRAFGWIVAGCLVGYLGTQLGAAWFDSQLGVIVGAFALGLVANAYALFFARPALVITVPAVTLLVPGSMGMRGMASLLDRDTLTGVEALFAMFIAASGAVAGVLIATAVLSPRRSL